MAETQTRIERWANGELVSFELVDKAPEQVNRDTIIEQAVTALQNNRDFIDLTAPTNAESLAQIKALTRQTNGIIRLILDRFDGTD
jgi:hypothetical protein